jgi:hypothetical protein
MDGMDRMDGMDQEGEALHLMRTGIPGFVSFRLFSSSPLSLRAQPEAGHLTR